MVFHIDQFVADCRDAVSQPDPESAVLDLMKRTVDDPAAVSAGLEPLDGDPMKAGDLLLGRDRTIFEDDNVTVFVVETEPGVLQPPHDHQMSAVIGVFEGTERNRFFTREDSGVVAGYGETSAGPGDIVVIKPDMIHAISATGETLCRALHVYTGKLSTVKRSIFHPDSGVEEEMTEERYLAYCRPDAD